MTDKGLIHAFLLDGAGRGQSMDWAQVLAWTPSMGRLWVHLDYTNATAREWLHDSSGLDPLVSDALLTEETRPRAISIGDGLLIALRGVNLNPGANPEDMVSIRLWADEQHVISTRKRDLVSVDDLVADLQRGKGPDDCAELIVDLIDRLVWRMNDTVDLFEEQIAEMEVNVLSETRGSLRFELSSLRRQTITLRRYLSPQRDALMRLIIEPMTWVTDEHRMQLREVSDRLIRHIEDIDAVRERASVTQEELLSRVSEELNKRMYVLSVVAAVFLPLGFFTGLLGINVGGVPGADNPMAFTAFVVLLIVIVAAQLWVFRRKRWL